GYDDKADKDNDGIPDACDTIDNTDSDMDGVIDSLDVCPGYDDKADADSDNIPDACDTTDDRDSDNDELTNAQESVYGTNPALADTDGDGLTDGKEVLTYLTNPLDSDSDNGGVLDGQEITNGTNPLNSNDDIPADPNKITGYVVNKDATILVSYADKTKLTIDPYAGYSQISADINGNSDRLIVTNGKYVSVYKRNTKIAQVQIGYFIPTSNTISVTHGSYDTIVIKYPLNKRNSMSITVKLENDKLNIVSAIRS
ncbi:MAG: thrombospondin type 3 repeat-containing protein, partial [Candidatus Woesearchaeota archaeon]